MRYEHSAGWWVEISGAADIPMREFGLMYENSAAARGILQRIIAGWRFTDWNGDEVPLLVAEPAAQQEEPESQPAVNVNGLSRRQYTWLLSRVMKAVLDEAADPEA